MNILLTGGAGYLGTELAHSLAVLPEVDEITVYDNLFSQKLDFLFANPYPKGKYKFVQADILDTRSLARAMKGIDAVFHLAAVKKMPEDAFSAHFMEQVNHWGSAEVAYAAEKEGVKKIFFVPPVTVYGHQAESVLADTSTNPADSYSASMLRGEAQILRLGNKATAISIRTGTIYGKGISNTLGGVVNGFVKDAHLKNKLSIHFSGKQYVPVVSLSVVCEVLTKILLNTEKSGISVLAEKNVQVLDLLDPLKRLYPDVEFVFTNHHLDILGCKVNTDFSIHHELGCKDGDIDQEFDKLKASFSF